MRIARPARASIKLATLALKALLNLTVWEKQRYCEVFNQSVVMAVEGPVRRTAALNRRMHPEATAHSDLSYRQDGEDASAREFLTGAPGTAERSDASSLPPHPSPAVRERQGEAPKAGKFKTVSQLVVAMNRFKGIFIGDCLLIVLDHAQLHAIEDSVWPIFRKQPRVETGGRISPDLNMPMTLKYGLLSARVNVHFIRLEWTLDLNVLQPHVCQKLY